MMSFNYFRGDETEQFQFYRIPKALFLEDISLEAAALYGLMLDRVGLSVRNGWADDQGRIYIYFTQKDVQKLLRCGHNRATAFMRELERFGLIRRKRQGLGKPDKIYVGNFTACEEAQPGTQRKDAERNQRAAFSSAQKEALQTAPGGRSGVPRKGGPDCRPEAANDTKKKETESSETNHILPTETAVLDFRGGSRRPKSPVRMDEMRWVREEIRENIDYEGLLTDRPGDRETVDGYVELMTETACSSGKTVRICGQELPAAEVRKRFLTLERPHIEYVRDCLRHTTRAIGNIKAYTLAALYNAPVTMEQFYDALVCRDYGALPPA